MHHACICIWAMLTLLSLLLLVACLSEPATESGQLCHVAPEHTGVEPDHQQESDEERTEAKCCSVSLIQEKSPSSTLIRMLSEHFWTHRLFPFAFLRSGMMESGVDRIITQVVDPKMNHSFRPRIETAIHDFLSGDRKEENGCSSVPSEQTEPQEAPSGCGPKTPWGLVLQKWTTV